VPLDIVHRAAACRNVPVTFTLCLVGSPVGITESGLRFVVASDVSDRDGKGVEVYRGTQLLVEVFRDDSKKAREVTLWQKDVPLEVVEEAIAIFRREVGWQFED
jgi:hypothetical protein